MFRPSTILAAVMLVLAVGLILTPYQPARSQGGITANELFKDPAKEARVREISKQLRCLKCQNQSIMDSNAGFARDLRNLVRERIKAGDTNAATVAYVVERYGDFVLLQPPVKPLTYVLWITPVVFLLLALGFGGIYLRRRASSSKTPSAALSEDEREAAQRILQGDAS